MNIYLVIILAILAGGYFLELIVEGLNLKRISPILPKEFANFYDAGKAPPSKVLGGPILVDKYKQSQDYLKENTRFKLTQGAVFTVVTVAFILIGGFNFVDKLARSFSQGSILTGLFFAGILMFSSQALAIPFSVYHTFVIEEKYGFNKTTVKTFIADILKGWFIGAIIGAIVLAFIIWFFTVAGIFGWLYCWAAITLFQLFLTFVSPVLILPLFNKFIPLEDGELKRAIQEYTASRNFKLQGIFKIDASRRSTKSNAFFTGFGKFRRIALFDNLIKKHTTAELVSVLAHEIGHYEKKHITKRLMFSFITTGLAFLLLSFFINNPGLFSAFRMNEFSICASLFFFALLYEPINFIFSALGNIISRRQEYQADSFVVSTYNAPQDFIVALKKLTVDNLSNLTPHPLKVFLHYSHPPVLARIKAIRKKIDEG